MSIPFKSFNCWKYQWWNESVMPRREVNAAVSLSASWTRTTMSPFVVFCRNIASWRNPAFFREASYSPFREPFSSAMKFRNSSVLFGSIGATNANSGIFFPRGTSPGRGDKAPLNRNKATPADASREPDPQGGSGWFPRERSGRIPAEYPKGLGTTYYFLMLNVYHQQLSGQIAPTKHGSVRR